MVAQAREVLEQEIRRLSAAKDFQGAVTAALKGYGSELYGCLVTLMGDRVEADEVFSELTSDLWSGLPGFEWRASFRTWAYTLLRNAASRYRAGAGQARARNVPLSQAGGAAQLEAVARTITATYQRTEVKSRFAELRKTLEPDEQLLLILRVDRQLEWSDIARVFPADGAGPQEPPEELPAAELTRRAALLRKRFQLLKDRLREEARRAGLLDEE